MNRRHVVSPPASSDELPGWSEGLTRWLIQHAARNAPPSLSERLEEEWLADLSDRSGTMARLRFGVGCCWATRVIAHEYSAPKVLATISATGNKVMNAYAQQDYSLFSRRTLAFVLIVGVHGVLIFVLANGLTHTWSEVIPPRIQAIVLPVMPKPVEQLPPLPQPTFTPTVLKIPQTEFPPQFPPDENTIQNVIPVVEDHGSAPPSTPPRAVKRVQGGPGKAFPNTADYYPPEAIRRGAMGLATVRACVDENGRLTAAPTLAQTSGTTSLDEGALRLAKAGSGHYRPGTEDGRPVSSCFDLPIRFRINN
jgi:TonB family protein